MRTKEVEQAIKEGKDYIEFMTTAGDNAEWAETLLSYIEELEKIPNKIRDKIKELEEDGYWEFLEDRDLERTITALKSIIGE